MTTDAEQLSQALDEAERKITRSWRGAGIGPAIEVLRTTDTAAVECSYPSLGWSPRFNACLLGVARALAVALSDQVCVDGFLPLHRSTAAHEAWAERALVELGTITHLRRMLDLSLAGVTNITRCAADTFEVSVVVADAERYDREPLEWFLRFVARHDRPYVKQSRKRYHLLRKCVAERTQLWLDSRLWYEFDERIETEFIERAMFRLHGLPGPELFDGTDCRANGA